MTDIQILLSIAGLVAAVVVAGALFWQRTRERGAANVGAQSMNRDGSMAFLCPVCGDENQIHYETLPVLSSAEKALVVRERPEVVGKELREYVCRQCDASHCFVFSEGRRRYIGANLYGGQAFGNCCVECRRPLERPPWNPGTHDGDLESAPGPIDSYGLRCRHCGAVTCVACCRATTRNRTKDGSLLCPRCFRGPQEHFFHPV